MDGLFVSLTTRSGTQMTKHKATPKQWSGIERFAKDCGYDSCLLELRARVEALEAAAKPAESNYPAEPDNSLVERVSDALMESVKDQRSMARAAILEIAAWLREQSPDVHLFNAGLVLDRELE